MTDTTDNFLTSHGSKPGAAHRCWPRALPAAVGAAALIVATMGPGALAAGAPAAGDVYVYRLVNGYSKEVRGQLRHQVDKVEGNNITLSVTPDNAAAGIERTEIVTREGNWLRNPLENHGWKVEYEFATSYPAYVFPLDAGKTWSVRVTATVPSTGQRRSVRVDGKVIGNERIRVPAGEFDTVKIKRLVYPGDWDYFLMETHIVEFDWYAPALGRAVRTERRSEYIDLSRCPEEGSCVHYGDWDVFELVQAPAAKS